MYLKLLLVTPRATSTNLYNKNICLTSWSTKLFVGEIFHQDRHSFRDQLEADVWEVNIFKLEGTL